MSHSIESLLDIVGYYIVGVALKPPLCDIGVQNDGWLWVDMTLLSRMAYAGGVEERS